MEKIDRFDFDCYVDSQEGESFAVLDKWKHAGGDYVLYEDHERVVKELEERCEDAYKAGRVEGWRECQDTHDGP